MTVTAPACRTFLFVHRRATRHEPQRQQEGDDADRHVDEEDPWPREVLRERPTENESTGSPPTAIAAHTPIAFVRSGPSSKVVVTIESAAGDTSAAPKTLDAAADDQELL